MEREKFKILLVENSSHYQEQFLGVIRSSLHAEVELATDGRSALKRIFGPLAPDLVLLDLDLPEVSGREVLRKIRAEQSLDSLPIICITDGSDIEMNLDILDSRADDFVARGSSTGVIIARIKTQMRHKLALDRLNRMAIDRDLFAAGVLHDVRNIETTISIVCEFTTMKIHKDPLAHQKEIGENLDLLIKSASKLGRYAADIIKTVRITERQVILQAVNLAKIFDWATDLITSRTAANHFEKIPWKAAGEMALVMGDEDFLKLAIFNIVQNSAKYSNPEGEKRLIVSQNRIPAIDNPLRNRIITRIRDFGLGVKETDLKKIFEPFKRGPNPIKGTGFGLGLSMVTTVISRIGGKVWAELPAEGPGLVVCIELAAEGQKLESGSGDSHAEKNQSI